MSGRAFGAATLVHGAAAGAPLLLDEPLSFWGGLDPVLGAIIDRRHPQAGANVAGVIAEFQGRKVGTGPRRSSSSRGNIACRRPNRMANGNRPVSS